jgi:myosin heavy subunit
MNRNATPGRLSASQSTAAPTPAMRSSQPLKSGKIVAGASSSRAEASGTKSPKRALEDDRDEYVTNLKGQIYLLTIENEMLKQTKGESAPEGERQSSVYASGAARAAEREKDAERAAYAVAAAAMPDELADLEAHMRTKYAQVEAKYQQDLADARRAAEALSTQCAAQSSLIAALKQEISSSNDVIAQQKHLMSSTEASLGADLRRGRDDIAELNAHVSALHAEGESAKNVIKAREISISDLRSRLAEAQAARQAAEHARTTILDSYARNYTALQVVLKRWREERIQALAARSALEVVRANRRSTCVHRLQSIMALADASLKGCRRRQS